MPAPLQKEIKDETGVKFGELQLSLFVGLAYDAERQEVRTVTPEQAQKVVEALHTAGAIDKGGKVQPTVKPEEIVFPQELEEVRETVLALVEKAEPVVAETLAGTVYTQTVVDQPSSTTSSDATSGC